MVSRGYVRRLGAPLGALVVMVFLSTAPVMAADTGVCVVDVDQPAAAGGSVFTFSGSGFAPTRLELTKDGWSPTVSEIDVGDADPWQLTVQSRTGDEGSWTATFKVDGGCTVSVQFRVTLASTDLISDFLGDQPTGSAPVAAYMLVIGFGLAGGAFLSRRLAAAQSQARH